MNGKHSKLKKNSTKVLTQEPKPLFQIMLANDTVKWDRESLKLRQAQELVKHRTRLRRWSLQSNLRPRLTQALG